jgi:hypothetical protein
MRTRAKRYADDGVGLGRWAEGLEAVVTQGQARALPARHVALIGGPSPPMTASSVLHPPDAAGGLAVAAAIGHVAVRLLPRSVGALAAFGLGVLAAVTPLLPPPSPQPKPAPAPIRQPQPPRLPIACFATLHGAPRIHVALRLVRLHSQLESVAYVSLAGVAVEVLTHKAGAINASATTSTINTMVAAAVRLGPTALTADLAGRALSIEADVGMSDTRAYREMQRDRETE